MFLENMEQNPSWLFLLLRYNSLAAWWYILQWLTGSPHFPAYTAVCLCCCDVINLIPVLVLTLRHLTAMYVMLELLFYAPLILAIFHVFFCKYLRQKIIWSLLKEKNKALVTKQYLSPLPPKVEVVMFSPLSVRLFLAKSKIFQVCWFVDFGILSACYLAKRRAFCKIWFLVEMFVYLYIFLFIFLLQFFQIASAQEQQEQQEQEQQQQQKLQNRRPSMDV